MFISRQLSLLKICHNNFRISKFAPLGFVQQYERIYLHTSPILEVEGKALKMPSLSPTMNEGTIIKWLKSEGDSIQAGDVICDIQTDKTAISFEMDDDSILAKILVEENKDVKVGTIIALLVDEGEDWRSVEMPAEEGVEDETPVETKTTKLSPVSSRHNFGPSVRNLLEKYDLNSNDITPSGPHTNLLKGDVLKVVKDKNLTPKKPEEPPIDVQPKKIEVSKSMARVDLDAQFVDIELSNMRKIIARRLTESKQQISHTYSTVEVTLGPLLEFRKKLKFDGFQVSVNDLLIKCVAASLQQHPEINCVWKGSELVSYSEVDISVAVATPSGLITPIVRRAHALGVEEISKVVRDLATRAKANKLKPEEFQGGTFTISNLGMFGIKEFTAIINPPQCAILAVGGGQMTLDNDGVPVTKMRATLSYDQLAISDDTAADFLQTFQSIIENPLSIILGSQKKSKSLLGLL